MKAVLLEVEDDSDVSQLLDHIVDLLCHEVSSVSARAVAELELILGVDSHETDSHGSEPFVINHHRQWHA